jgi:hypothetical protein
VKKAKNNQSGAGSHQFLSIFLVLISSSIYSWRKKHHLLLFLSLVSWKIRYVNLRVPLILFKKNLSENQKLYKYSQINKKLYVLISGKNHKR